MVHVHLLVFESLFLLSPLHYFCSLTFDFVSWSLFAYVVVILATYSCPGSVHLQRSARVQPVSTTLWLQVVLFRLSLFLDRLIFLFFALIYVSRTVPVSCFGFMYSVSVALLHDAVVCLLTS